MQVQAQGGELHVFCFMMMMSSIGSHLLLCLLAGNLPGGQIEPVKVGALDRLWNVQCMVSNGLEPSTTALHGDKAVGGDKSWVNMGA